MELDALNRICRHLGCSIDDLLEYIPEQKDKARLWLWEVCLFWARGMVGKDARRSVLPTRVQGEFFRWERNGQDIDTVPILAPKTKKPTTVK